VLGTLVTCSPLAHATMKDLRLAIFALAFGVRLQNLARHFPVAKGLLPSGLHTMDTVLDLPQKGHYALLERQAAQHVAMCVVKETNAGVGCS